MLIVASLLVFLCISDNNTADDLTIGVETLNKSNSFTKQAITIYVHFVITENFVINVISNILKSKIEVDGKSFKIKLKTELLDIALIMYEVFYTSQQQPHNVANQRYKLSKLSLVTQMLQIAGIIDSENLYFQANLS